MQNAQISALSNVSKPPITVLIAEDDELHRLSLRLSLEGQNICIVGEACDGPEAVRAAIEHKPSVVLMDLGLPGFDGIIATKQIKRATDARVLIFSSNGEKKSVLSALKAGADGYCAKQATKEQLVSAIVSVFNHGTWLSDDVANTVISQLSSIDPEGSSESDTLTDLELKILNMILEGADLDGIALGLGVHENQIYAHSQRLMTKLSQSRIDLNSEPTGALDDLCRNLQADCLKADETADSGLSNSVSRGDIARLPRDNSRRMCVSAEHRLSRICPRCHTSWPLTKMVCTFDGTPTKIDNLIGTIFAERYEILSVLGSGAGGTVYKAKHRFMLKLVAIKIMHPSTAKKLQSLQRFRHEAIASSFLTHPNIVSVLDFGVTEKGLAFMIMDYYHGDSLARFIEKHGPLSAEEAIPLFKQLCDGLEHAHQNGVLHRDMKPSNVIVSGVGSQKPLARILDFGTSILTKEVPGLRVEPAPPGFVFGSPLYMSPEQCRGAELDITSDIYSMGCLMYETIAGHSAIKADTITDALMHQLFKVPLHVGKTQSGCMAPAMLQGIIMRTLRKDPKLRYQSAAELKSYLEEVDLDS